MELKNTCCFTKNMLVYDSNIQKDRVGAIPRNMHSTNKQMTELMLKRTRWKCPPQARTACPPLLEAITKYDNIS